MLFEPGRAHCTGMCCDGAGERSMRIQDGGHGEARAGSQHRDGAHFLGSLFRLCSSWAHRVAVERPVICGAAARQCRALHFCALGEFFSVRGPRGVLFTMNYARKVTTTTAYHAKLTERCSDDLEDQGAEEALWGQERIVSWVLESRLPCERRSTNAAAFGIQG